MLRCIEQRATNSPWCKPRCIQLALNPVWRRCFSVKYCPYSPSARLALAKPGIDDDEFRCYAGFHHGLLALHLVANDVARGLDCFVECRHQPVELLLVDHLQNPAYCRTWCQPQLQHVTPE